MKYNESILKPPGPMVDVAVFPVGRTAPSQIKDGKLDTGADNSNIPETLATELGLLPEQPIATFGYDGVETKRMTYLVDLEIAGYKIEQVRVVAVPRSTILLGRNVLNHFIITLDGKALTFEMQDP